MPNSLEGAKKLAEPLRFAGDIPSQEKSNDTSRMLAIRNSFYKHGLEISDKTTPKIGKAISVVCKKLKISNDSVKAFVYAAPDIQAECYAGANSECIIRFTSGLIELLDEEEFTFVAGHELAHFLFDHAIQKFENENYNFFKKLRAQEISADRLGLITCGSIDVAVRALMKTVSGLDERHLRFNVGEFVGQLGKISDAVSSGDQTNTHPSMVLRCRALLWFSMSNSFVKFPETQEPSELQKIDRRVLSDLNRDLDSHMKLQIKECKETISLWFAALKIVETGAFNHPKQELVASIFGQDTLTKLKNFLADLELSEVKNVVLEKVQSSTREFQILCPDNYDEEILKLEDQIRKLLKF